MAAPPTRPGGAAAPAAEGSGWVERIRQAGQQRSFSGTLVTSTGHVVSASKVARTGQGDRVVERVEALDGPQQRSLRSNDLIQTIWPQQKVVTVERRARAEDASGLPELDPRLQAHYELIELGHERLARREATVLLLNPRDDLRFAQRLWADQSTGLLLRADVLTAQGQVLESTAFSDIEIGSPSPRDTAGGPTAGAAPRAAVPARSTARAGSGHPAEPPLLEKPEGYRIVQLTSQPTTLEAEGWQLARPPAGFRLVGCVRRPVGEPGDEPAATALRAIQAVYTDGLARVSVFLEAADPARPRQALVSQLGATHTVVRPRDKWWVTLVGDVPLNTLTQFAEALLPRRP